VKTCLCLTLLLEGLGDQNVETPASHRWNRRDADRFLRLGKKAKRVGEIQHQATSDCIATAALNNPDIVALYRQTGLKSAEEVAAALGRVADRLEREVFYKTSRNGSTI
jgi:hypothetical protein